LINLLESIHTSYVQTKAILSRRKQQSRVNAISQKLVEEIIRLLKPFKRIMKLVQTGTTPSLYLVLPCTLILRKILNSFDDLLAYIDRHETNANKENEMEDDTRSVDFDDQEEDEGKQSSNSISFGL